MRTQLQRERMGSPFGMHTNTHAHNTCPHKYCTHTLESMTSLLGPSVAGLACLPSHQHDPFATHSTIFIKSSSCGLPLHPPTPHLSPSVPVPVLRVSVKSAVVS